MQQKELIEKKIRGKIKKLIRNIVKTTEGLTVNDQITLQDINLPEPNIALPLQLPPNVSVIVDEITNNALIKISPKALPDLPEPETQVIDTDIDQGLDTETINYFEDNYISKILPEIPEIQELLDILTRIGSTPSLPLQGDKLLPGINQVNQRETTIMMIAISILIYRELQME